ncbi:MAG: FimV/HubP family polar landmark protein, partial [Pseudomonadota bacterium]
LDEVDMAALDDDGTLNLEELTGDQMSGLDLGALDLTNPEGDSTLDNLTLDDADLNSLGDISSGVRDGLSADIDLEEGTISRTDEMETMLDLAKAYIDMGDSDSAESALKDIITHGSDAQKMEAQDLLSNLK